MLSKRFFHSSKEIKRKRLNGYFDFETYNIGNPEEPEAKENNVAVYAVGLLTDTGKYLDWFGLDSLDKFIDYIEEKASTRPLVINLIAHNCFFDYHFFLEKIDERGPDANIHASFTDDARSGICAEIKVKSKGIDIKFKDTGCWDHSMSLARGSEMLNLPFKKLQLEDYNKGNIEKRGVNLFYNQNKKINISFEKEYLRHDVFNLPAIYDAITKFKEIIINLPIMPAKKHHKKHQVMAKITKSGLSKCAMEQYISDSLENVYRTEIDHPVYQKMKASFFGAFTSGNIEKLKVKLDKAIIKSYDMNSMYPSIMREGLPMGDLLLLKPKGEYVIGYEYEMTYCNWKKQYAFFTADFISKAQQGVMKRIRAVYEEKGKKHQPRGYMLKEYYDLCKKLCDTDIKIVEVYYQEVTHALDHFFEYLYEERLKAKKEGRTEDAESLKLTMNSAFGKFCENAHERRGNGNNEIKQYETVEEKNVVYSSIMTGLYITTQGRLRLINAILNEIQQGNEFLYCDTDSIKMIEHKQPLFEINNTKLGAGKAEGEFNGFLHPHKLKRGYTYNDLGQELQFKFASSGFDKRIIESLNHEEKLIFYDAEINTLVRNGKKVRNLRTKYGKTQLYDTDVVTLDIKKPIDYICEQGEDKVWRIRRNEGH